MNQEQNPKSLLPNAIVTVFVAVASIISLIADIEAVSNLWYSKILLLLILSGSISYLIYLIYINAIKILSKRGLKSLETINSLISNFQKKYNKSEFNKNIDSEVINSIINARKLKKQQLAILDFEHLENKVFRIIIDKGDIHGVRQSTSFTVRHKLRLTIVGECRCESILQETTILQVKGKSNLPFEIKELDISDIAVWVLEPGEIELEKTKIDPEPINRFIADLLCSIEVEKERLSK